MPQRWLQPPFPPFASLIVTENLKHHLAENKTNLRLTIITDSTGNGSTEWPRKIANAIASDFPTYSVVINQWIEDGTSFGAVVRVSTGTGPNTFYIDRLAQGGSTIDYFLGDLFTPAVVVRRPDLMIISHGLNYAAMTEPQVYNSFNSSLNLIRREYPHIPICLFLQNPHRDDDEMAHVIEAVSDLAREREDIELIDIYSLFIAEGKDPGLYADNIHPDDDGQILYNNAFMSKFDLAP